MERNDREREEADRTRNEGQIPLADHPVGAIFWQQMDWIQPQIYVSDNQNWLAVVSHDVALVESVSRKLADL
jgi:hypothetical protein